MIDHRLESLLTLNRNNPVVADCLERISQAGEIRCRGDARVPVNEIIDIYSVRERINSKRGGRVEGYEGLLPALKAATVPFVKLHSLEFLSHWFIVFTDEPSSILFGVLKSPKQKAAWYDPVKGYEE